MIREHCEEGLVRLLKGIFRLGTLAEGILRIVKDARERLLKPAAQIIPCAATIYAVPISYYPSGAASLKAAGVRCGFWDTLLSPDLGPLFVDLMGYILEGDPTVVRSLLWWRLCGSSARGSKAPVGGAALGTTARDVAEDDTIV
eukprot:gene28480-35314_t